MNQKTFKTSFAKTLSLLLAFLLFAGSIPAGVFAAPKTKIGRVNKVRAIKKTTHSITLTWKKTGNAKKYKVYMQKKGWGDWKKISKKKYTVLKKTKKKTVKVRKIGQNYYSRKYGKSTVTFKNKK